MGPDGEWIRDEATNPAEGSGGGSGGPDGGSGGPAGAGDGGPAGAGDGGPAGAGRDRGHGVSRGSRSGRRLPSPCSPRPRGSPPGFS